MIMVLIYKKMFILIENIENNITIFLVKHINLIY